MYRYLLHCNHLMEQTHVGAEAVRTQRSSATGAHTSASIRPAYKIFYLSVCNSDGPVSGSAIRYLSCGCVAWCVRPNKQQFSSTGTSSFALYVKWKYISNCEAINWGDVFDGAYVLIVLLQPLNPCLLPHSNRFSTFTACTNPYISNVGGIVIAGHSGEPISDIQRQTVSPPSQYI